MERNNQRQKDKRRKKKNEREKQKKEIKRPARALDPPAGSVSLAQFPEGFPFQGGFPFQEALFSGPRKGSRQEVSSPPEGMSTLTLRHLENNGKTTTSVSPLFQEHSVVHF